MSAVEAEEKRTATYDPRVFEAGGEEAARAIILTPEQGQTTAERWARETPYLARLACEHLQLRPNRLALDFGCGIGRLAKAMIVGSGCAVVGLDTSAGMRRLASGYVREDSFAAISPAMLSFLDLRFDAAIAVWTLQHCFPVQVEVDRLRKVLKTGGALMVVNELGRFVPTDRGWVDDGEDVRALLEAAFGPPFHGAGLDPSVVGEAHAARGAYVAFYRKA